MPSINVDFAYWNHPKTRKLVGLLGRGAEIWPLKLWTHCGLYARNGVITEPPASLTAALGYRGKPEALINALVEAGFMLRTKRAQLVAKNFFKKQRHILEFSKRAKRAAHARWGKTSTVNEPMLGASDKQCSEQSISNALTLHSSTVQDVDVTPTSKSTDTSAANVATLEPPNIATLLKTMSNGKALNGAGKKTHKDYAAPSTDLQKFLLVVKQLQGYALDDRQWDEVYFKRYGRAAKDVLTFFSGDWKRAGECAAAIAHEMDSLGRPWTVETVIKLAPAWKTKNA